MKNTFGNNLTVTLFGESHGTAIGAVMDGVPSGVRIDMNIISRMVNQRKAAGTISTGRKEDDIPEFVSGVKNGVTEGTAFFIQNKNVHSSDYNALENVVYFELLRRGYDVSIGKVDNSEVDFIATNVNDKIYIQVTESMTSEDVRKRELAPLQKINDNYEKIVLSMNTGLDSSYEGIKSINLIDWLISN